MNYAILAGIVIGMWLLELCIAIWFKKATKGQAPTYEKLIIDSGNNIFVYGFGGIIGLFLGNMFSGIFSYIIFGITAIIVLVGILPFLVLFGSTIILSFNKSHKGINDLGKKIDWIFLFARIVENIPIVIIFYKMFIAYFN